MSMAVCLCLVLAPGSPFQKAPEANRQPIPPHRLFTFFDEKLGGTRRVEALAVSPDGRTLAVAREEIKVQIMDAVTGKGLRTLQGHDGGVYALAFSPDGKLLASGSGDNTIRLWETSTFRHLATLACTDYVVVVMFSPDGARLITGAGNDDRFEVIVWDLQSRKAKLCFKGSGWGPTSLALSPDSTQLVGGGWGPTIRRWDLVSGKELPEFKGHKNFVTSVAFSPDGKAIASVSYDDTTRVWDGSTGQEIRILAQGRLSSDVCILPKTNLLGLFDAREVTWWDTKSWKQAGRVGLYTDEEDVINKVAFSANGKVMATGSWDGSIKVWEVEKLLKR